jgi:hypothetical protein
MRRLKRGVFASALSAALVFSMVMPGLALGVGTLTVSVDDAVTTAPIENAVVTL